MRKQFGTRFGSRWKAVYVLEKYKVNLEGRNKLQNIQAFTETRPRVQGAFHRISLPNVAYVITRISEIPNISTGISGFPYRFFRDFLGISNVS